MNRKIVAVGVMALMLFSSLMGFATAELTEENMMSEFSKAWFENCYLRTKLGMECKLLTEDNFINELGNAWAELPYLRKLWYLRNLPKPKKSSGGGGGSSSPTPEPEPVEEIVETIKGDLDGDGKIGPADLDWVLGYWGQNCTETNDYCKGADINGDDFVGGDDQAYILDNWGYGYDSEPED